MGYRKNRSTAIFMKLLYRSVIACFCVGMLYASVSMAMMSDPAACDRAESQVKDVCNIDEFSRIKQEVIVRRGSADPDLARLNQRSKACLESVLSCSRTCNLSHPSIDTTNLVGFLNSLVAAGTVQEIQTNPQAGSCLNHLKELAKESTGQGGTHGACQYTGLRDAKYTDPEKSKPEPEQHHTRFDQICKGFEKVSKIKIKEGCDTDNGFVWNPEKKKCDRNMAPQPVVASRCKPGTGIDCKPSETTTAEGEELPDGTPAPDTVVEPPPRKDPSTEPPATAGPPTDDPTDPEDTIDDGRDKLDEDTVSDAGTEPGEDTAGDAGGGDEPQDNLNNDDLRNLESAMNNALGNLGGGGGGGAGGGGGSSNLPKVADIKAGGAGLKAADFKVNNDFSNPDVNISAQGVRPTLALFRGKQKDIVPTQLRKEGSGGQQAARGGNPGMGSNPNLPGGGTKLKPSKPKGDGRRGRSSYYDIAKKMLNGSYFGGGGQAAQNNNRNASTRTRTANNNRRFVSNGKGGFIDTKGMDRAEINRLNRTFQNNMPSYNGSHGGGASGLFEKQFSSVITSILKKEAMLNKYGCEPPLTSCKAVERATASNAKKKKLRVPNSIKKKKRRKKKRRKRK